MKSVFETLDFDSNAPVIARAGGRSLVGSLHFSLSSIIQQYLRAKQFGLRSVEEGNDIDKRNTEDNAREAHEVELGMRFDQGFEKPEDYLPVIAKYKTIREAIANHLLQHAAQVPMLSDPTKTMPDARHVASSFSESLDFQEKRQPTYSAAQLRAEAKALNCTEDEIKAAFVNRNNRQIDYLKRNRSDIEATYNDVDVGDPSLEDAEAAFNELTPMQQLRIVAALDNGLYRARQREVEMHLAGNQNAAGNCAMIDDSRRGLIAFSEFLCKEPTFARAIDVAIGSGQTAPKWAPKPAPKAADEVDEARAKHEATA